MIKLPADEPHALKAIKKFKMILIMIRWKTFFTLIESN
jgi:hypothetical protein